MGPGFKYHVVTIAAIFFALTIGLVVGSLSISPYIVRSQSRLLKSLDTKVNKDIKEREQSLDHYRKCLSAIMPIALNGKLTGHNIVIVNVGDYADEISGLRDALESAGGHVAGVVMVDRSLERPDELLKQKLISLHADDDRIPETRTGLMDRLASILIHGDDPARPLLPVLDRGDLIRTDSPEGWRHAAQDTVQDVVIVAGSRMDSVDRTENANRVANLDAPLIAALQVQQANVAMCEPELALSSDVPVYHSQNIDIATVDNVDSDIGRCALVFVLRGAKEDYGVKPTAKELLPPATSPDLH